MAIKILKINNNEIIKVDSNAANKIVKNSAKSKNIKKTLKIEN